MSSVIQCGGVSIGLNAFKPPPISDLIDIFVVFLTTGNTMVQAVSHSSSNFQKAGFPGFNGLIAPRRGLSTPAFGP